MKDKNYRILKKLGGVNDLELLDELNEMIKDGELIEKDGKYILTEKGLKLHKSEVGEDD